jgi:hypothetical protein
VKQIPIFHKIAENLWILGLKFPLNPDFSALYSSLNQDSSNHPGRFVGLKFLDVKLPDRIGDGRHLAQLPAQPIRAAGVLLSQDQLGDNSITTLGLR